MSTTLDYSSNHKGEIPCFGGKVKCPCGKIISIYTPKNQGTKDAKRRLGKKASPKHIFILKSFMENPYHRLTINDLVLKVRKHKYFETGKTSLWDKADITHERADLVTFGILDTDGTSKTGAPYYVLKDVKRAKSLLNGEVF